MEGRHFGPLPRASKNPHGTTVAIPSHYPLPSLPFYFRLFSLPSHLFPHPLSVPKLEFGVSDLEKIANLHVCVCFSSVWLQNCGRSSCTTALKVVQRQNTRLPRSFRHKRRESIVPPPHNVRSTFWRLFQIWLGTQKPPREKLWRFFTGRLYFCRPTNNVKALTEHRESHSVLKTPLFYSATQNEANSTTECASMYKQAVGGRPPQYAPPSPPPVGAEAHRAAEQTAT